MGADGALIAGRGRTAGRRSTRPAVATATRAGAATASRPRRPARWPTAACRPEAVAAAVAAASGFVACGGAAAARAHAARRIPASPSRPRGRAGRARAPRGGTVVATGGCFDLLHAGHVQMLERAPRARRLPHRLPELRRVGRPAQGPDRPLNDEHDRAACCGALRCVDEVAVFGEDTPEAVLATLRPHLWCQGRRLRRRRACPRRRCSRAGAARRSSCRSSPAARRLAHHAGPRRLARHVEREREHGDDAEHGPGDEDEHRRHAHGQRDRGGEGDRDLPRLVQAARQRDRRPDDRADRRRAGTVEEGARRRARAQAPRSACRRGPR
jgi:hypothetical protein